MNLPNGPYRPIAPSAREAEPYLPWLINKAVRLGRDFGYANLVDDGLELLLADLGVRRPAGGFVDSDGRNAQGRTATQTAAAEPVEEIDEDEVASVVDGWSTEYAAAILTALAGRVG